MMNKDNFTMLILLVFAMGIFGTITNCGIRLTGDRIIEVIKEPCSEKTKDK